MGFYDLRCALTGLSLKGQRCDLLLLRRSGGRVEPLWGTITGSYNRLGTIDDPPTCPAELSHLAESFAALLGEGRLVSEGDPLAPTDSFFERFEANRHRVRLDGDDVALTLFHHRVMEHLVRDHGDADAALTDEALFARAFEGGKSIAPFAPLGLGRGLRRLLALRRWLGKRPIPLPRAPEQHTEEDIVRSIRDAKKRTPALVEAIEKAERDDYRLVTARRG